MQSLYDYFTAKKHIIWDWNGTLLNDAPLCTEIIGELLEEHGQPRLTLENYRAQFGFPVVDYYKRVGFDLAKVSFEIVADEWDRRYRERVNRCQLFPGAQDLLRQVSASKIPQSLLSAAKEEDLHTLLDRYGISSHFDSVFGLRDHYAAGKVERGKQMMEQLGVGSKDMLMVGDTEHDVEVAQALGIEILLLTNGHSTKARLSATGATVVERPVNL